MTKKFGSAHQQNILSLSAKKSKARAGSATLAFERSKEAEHIQQPAALDSQRPTKIFAQRRTMAK